MTHSHDDTCPCGTCRIIRLAYDDNIATRRARHAPRYYLAIRNRNTAFLNAATTFELHTLAEVNATVSSRASANAIINLFDIYSANPRHDLWWAETPAGRDAKRMVREVVESMEGAIGSLERAMAPTNPATHALLDSIGEVNIKSYLSAPDILNHD